MTKAITVALLLLAVPLAAAQQTPEQMRREIEEEFAKLRANDEESARREAAAQQRARHEAQAAKAVEKLRWKPCGNEGMAYVMSQEAVKRVLKSPATASFPHAPFASEFLGDCKWSIIGQVDAQNAFGAKLRTSYTAIMQFDPGSNTWSAAGVQVAPVR